MSFPAYNDTSSFQGPQQMELEQFVSYLQGYLSAQHKDDGSHAAITADSLTLAQPASPITTGNVTNDLVPTKDATFNLGAAVAFQSVGLAWANLYLSTAMYLGSVSSGGLNPVIGPLMSDLFSGPTRTTSIFGATGGTHFWTVKSPTGGTLMVLGGAGLVGPGFFHDDVVTIPAALKLTGTVGADSGLYERTRNFKLGEWVSPAFDATIFTAATGTWTVVAGNQVTFSYTVIGKTMTVAITLNTTSVSATPATLSIAIPGGFTAAADVRNLCVNTDNGTVITGMLRVTAGATTISCYRDLVGSNWATAVNATGVVGQVTFPIQ